MKKKSRRITLPLMILAAFMMICTSFAFAAPVQEGVSAENAVEKVEADFVKVYSEEAYGVSVPPAGSANVMLNGQYITFDADTQPVNLNGRIMVPYRAMLEYLGAEVDYDQATREIKGKTDDLSLSMKNGDYNINVTKADGTTEVVKMDVAPYIQNNRTYVPTRFVSEVLDYSIGWDAENKTVIIIDKESILKNADSDFTTFMKLNELSADMDKTYDVTGTVDGNVNVPASADTEAQNVILKGSVNGLAKGVDEDLSMDFNINENGKASDMQARVKFNGETGDMYMKADEVTEEGQWLRLNVYDICESMGMDIRALIDMSSDGSASMKDILSAYFDMISETYDIYTYDVMSDIYDILNAVIGNDAFEKSENGYVSEFDENTIAQAVKGSADIDDMLPDIGIGGSKLSGRIVINTDEADKATGYEMEIGAQMQGMDMNIALKSSALDAAVSMSMNIENTLDMDFDINISMREGSGAVDTSIPAGDTVIDLNSLLGDMAK